MKSRVRAADAILFSTPEYNYSMPGVLKNAIDWASRPYGDSAWQGKPVAVMGASVGVLGSARAQYHLRQCFIFLNMYPVNQPEVLIANAAQRFNEQGELTDEYVAGADPEAPGRARRVDDAAEALDRPSPALSPEGRGCVGALAPGGGEGRVRGRSDLAEEDEVLGLEHALEQQQEERAGTIKTMAVTEAICSS